MNRNDGALSAEQRERIADACDAAYDFGDTWVRFLRNGNESMLLPVIADLIADAKAEALRDAARTLPGFADGINTHGDAARWLRLCADRIDRKAAR